MPHNLTLIVGGKLQGGTESLLSVVQNQIEPSLIEAGFDKGAHPPGWKRPFLETASARRTPFTSQAADVEFPEKDESNGELVLAFQGPPSKDQLTLKVTDFSFSLTGCAYSFIQALDILALYLTSSSVAPLNKEYVEREDPLW